MTKAGKFGSKNIKRLFHTETTETYSSCPIHLLQGSAFRYEWTKNVQDGHNFVLENVDVAASWPSLSADGMFLPRSFSRASAKASSTLDSSPCNFIAKYSRCSIIWSWPKRTICRLWPAQKRNLWHGRKHTSDIKPCCTNSAANMLAVSFSVISAVNCLFIISSSWTINVISDPVKTSSTLAS